MTIPLLDWSKLTSDNFFRTNGVLKLLFQMVQYRKKNNNALRLYKDKCYYDKVWYLTWKYEKNNIEDFIKETLKLGCLNNHITIENDKFFRYFDILYRECVNNDLISISKIKLIEKILLNVDHDGVKFNLIQYIEKEKILKKFYDNYNFM